MKDLCTNKRKLKTNELVNLSANISTIYQRKLPSKCKDKGSFVIPIRIGDTHVVKAMCDLGASINVIPYSVFLTLNIGTLEETGIVIQLADRSVIHPIGIVEDVLVQVDKLMFPADFYVIKTEMEHDPSSVPILLGRPFLRTSRTNIDCWAGILTMEFDGKVVMFNIDETMKHPPDVHAIFAVDTVDILATDVTRYSTSDPLQLTVSGSELIDAEQIFELKLVEMVKEIVMDFSMNIPITPTHQAAYLDIPLEAVKLKPSVIEPPTLELKALPQHLKYAFLRDNETLPVIISSKLSKEQEFQLIEVLSRHKKAIGWTVADIKELAQQFACIAFCLKKMQNQFVNLKED